MIKRKAEAKPPLKSALRKRAKIESNEEELKGCFNKTLFDDQVLENYTKEHARSEPYKHCVIHNLMNDDLLRNVRNEVREHVHFTPKETDIYRIHQSGDLANLDGLDDAALEKLPSLLKLRDALYSPIFRKYVAQITGSDELSGKKTDMAINVYTPGCHLLCHDDVIGSRRVSYILYLTDPDIAWKEEWGGALRLFPTDNKAKKGEPEIRVPTAYTWKSIPPAWNQLSFFTVQPGLSFHDVEEVYHAETKEQLEKEGGRIRMAISGWFHIPQKGEDGYTEGLEQKLAEQSSLTQLQKRGDEFDYPKEIRTSVSKSVAEGKQPEQESTLEEADIEFLLKYLTPTYLTPDTMEQVTAHFEENSSIELENILSKKFSQKVRDYIESSEAAGEAREEGKGNKGWQVATPPHKHRFLYLQPGKTSGKDKELNPIEEIIQELLPSAQFLKWLELATGCDIEDHSVLARRFRRGLDYSLATSHEGKAQLELSIGLTPTPGWGADEDDEEEEEEEEANGKAASNSKKPEHNGSSNGNKDEAQEEDEGVGGHEVYMAGDDGEDEDAAIYKTSSDDVDDNILFTVPAAWNKMSIVLRDSGVLRFTKYVSRKANGDRWDVSGTYGVADDGDEDDEESGDQEEPFVITEKSDEEEFNGFSDSPDDNSDSD